MNNEILIFETEGKKIEVQLDSQGRRLGYNPTKKPKSNLEPKTKKRI